MLNETENKAWDKRKLKQAAPSGRWANKWYHIEFGSAKSKILKIGKNKHYPDIYLGENKMEYVNTYKYLGEMFNHKGNAEEHIIQQKKKTEAAYQTINKAIRDGRPRPPRHQVGWSDGNVHVKFHDDRLRNGGDITYWNFMETRFGDLRPWPLT